MLPHLDYALFCIKSPIPGGRQAMVAGCRGCLGRAVCREPAGQSKSCHRKPLCKLLPPARLPSTACGPAELRPAAPDLRPCCAAEKYEWITKRQIGPALGFVGELEQRGIPYWVGARTGGPWGSNGRSSSLLGTRTQDLLPKPVPPRPLLCTSPCPSPLPLLPSCWMASLRRLVPA